MELKNNFPGSPWTKQAVAILDLSEQLHRQQQRAVGARAEPPRMTSTPSTSSG